MKKRASLSKRLRFEIFKRDGFKCLYCGATPVQTTLRVDHVKPVAEGGADDPANLVTSCFDCNAGKGPVPLEKRKHAAGVATEADREHAEQIREWLKIQREVEDARSDVVEALLAAWSEEIGEPDPDTRSRLRACLTRNSVDQIREAISATSVKRLYGNRQLKYFYGVLRAKRGDAPPPQPTPPPPKRRWSERAERVMRHMVAWQKAQAQHTITDVLLEFASAAWASPSALEYADYYEPESPGGDRSRIRGLVLRTEKMANGRISWWVEDELEIVVAIEVLNEIHTAENNDSHNWSALSAKGDGAPLVTREECEASRREAEAYWAEGEEFLRYLKTGDERQLRACREHYGWPCPAWRAD